LEDVFVIEFSKIGKRGRDEACITLGLCFDDVY